MPGLWVSFQTSLGGITTEFLIKLAFPPALIFEVTETKIPSLTSDLENDSNFISSDNLKTINGESLLGEGNLTVNTEANVQAVDTEEIVDDVTVNYATKEELNSKQDVISDIEVIRQGAAKGATALQSYTEKYTGTITGITMNGASKGTSGVVNLGTVITEHQDISGKQDKLVSGTSIKTINGESILGSGDIEISGGGSSGGEGIRYFTEFTVEDFIAACEANNTITYDTTELFNAMKSNKIICVPYRGYDKGFIVASYKSGEDEEYPSMYLQKGDVEYCASAGDNSELIGDAPIYNNVQVVKMAGGEVSFEVLDNHIYRITDPVDYLFPVPSNLQKGATIHFMSGESGTTIMTYGVFWANGEIPQIEPNTHYELSLMLNSAYEYNAVLTKFKLVE
jgi:hypothetical protein